MQKILFWSLNIIISSNILLYALGALLGATIFKHLDLYDDFFVVFIILIITSILYIIFKVQLFYIIPVKKLKYFNHIFSQIFDSSRYRKIFFLKIFIMDIILNFVYLLIESHGHLFTTMRKFIPYIILNFGGILPSYLIYYWQESNHRKAY